MPQNALKPPIGSTIHPLVAFEKSVDAGESARMGAGESADMGEEDGMLGFVAAEVCGEGGDEVAIQIEPSVNFKAVISQVT